MKRLTRYTIIGTVFVSILGTLSHFFYEWSDNSIIVGLFSPVNESTWEHMKLIFFPMLIFSIWAIPRLKSDYPCIASSLLSGILLGTALIPVIFYTYTGILGYNLLALDIATFALSVIIAFYTAYRLTTSCRMQKYIGILYAAICIILVCFVLFTFFPPDIGLFASPD